MKADAREAGEARIEQGLALPEAVKAELFDHIIERSRYAHTVTALGYTTAVVLREAGLPCSPYWT